MARRRGGYREPEPGRPGEGGRRFARRSRSNDGLWIALGIAGVLGIVFFFAISSSSSGDPEKEAATKALVDYFAVAVKKDEAAGLRMLAPKLAVAGHNPDRAEKWLELTPAERTAALREVFEFHCRLMADLDVARLGAAEQLLASATVSWDPLPGRVTFKWFRAEGPWVAEVKQSDDRWLVTLLERDE